MLRVVFTRGFFVARTDYASRGIPKEAGFRWHSERKVWYTEEIGDAVKLRAYADPFAKRILDRQTITQAPWLGGVPFPKKLRPYDFQLDPAASFSLERSKSYNALEMGLGKSIVAALIANALQSPAVMISPPFLTRNIEAEFGKWMTPHYGEKPAIVRLDTKEAPIERPAVLIVPDSIMHRPEVREEILDVIRYADLLGKEPLLMVDEAHRFKTETALRTRTLFGDKKTAGIIADFPRQVYFSGTPMPNRPIELYPILSKVAPETIDFMSYADYGMRFCDGKIAEENCSKCYGTGSRAGSVCAYCRGRGGFENGYDFTGASNLAELRSRVYGKFMLRLRKKDVLKSLPPKTEEMIIIGELPRRLIGMDADLLAKYSPVDLMAGQVSSDHTSVYRRELGNVKVKPALDFITSLLEDSEEPLVVFAYHKEVIARLTEKLAKYRPLVITGKTPKGERHAIVHRFQNDPTRRLFIGNYLAAGVGLTLTKARRVVMVEFSWVPAENDQAIDRTHRISQDRDVHAYYLVFENSIDRKLMETNFRKKGITGYI